MRLAQLLEDKLEPLTFKYENFDEDTYRNLLKILRQKDNEFNQPTKFIVHIQASPNCKINGWMLEILKSLRERSFRNFKKNTTALIGTQEQYKEVLNYPTANNCFASGVGWIDIQTGKRIDPLAWMGT